MHYTAQHPAGAMLPPFLSQARLMSSTVETADTPRDIASTAVAMVQLTKPGVTRLVLVMTACGALAAPGRVELGHFLIMMLGTALVVGAANTLNMYLERESDRAMERTRTRPLPSGRLAPETALWFGVALALVSLPILSFAVNPLTGLLAATALISYVLCYTPLKRVTPWALHVGAVPGAIPPLIGWAAVSGSLDARAWSLFALLYVWQLPHFLAIAMFRCKDYENAGMRVLPAVKGMMAAKRAAVVYSVLLLATSVLPFATGLGGALYLGVALLLGLVFLVWAARGLAPDAGVRWARSLFFASLPYLVLVSTALVVGVLVPGLN